MRKTISVVAGFALISVILLAADKAPATAQSQRGLEIFLHSSKGTACGTCHSLAGYGNAVGPDLTTMATYGTVHVLVSTMHMTMTEHVMRVKSKDGEFPGIQKPGEETAYWDLSQRPPVLRQLEKKEVESLVRDQKWQHPPASAEYTSQELADLIGFLKWAATGSVKEIKPSEVEE